MWERTQWQRQLALGNRANETRSVGRVAFTFGYPPLLLDRTKKTGSPAALTRDNYVFQEHARRRRGCPPGELGRNRAKGPGGPYGRKGPGCRAPGDRSGNWTMG